MRIDTSFLSSVWPPLKIPEKPKPITASQWNQIFVAGDDLSSVIINPIIKGHPLENFDAYISNIHSPR